MVAFMDKIGMGFNSTYMINDLAEETFLRICPQACHDPKSHL